MNDPPRVLVADDELVVRDLFASFLRTKGYAVLTARTGDEAVATVQRERPDLVLLDICMPTSDGLQALQQIRTIDPHVGVIMVTGVVDETVADEALRLTAYDYITKPVDLGYLELAIITKLAEQARTDAMEGGDNSDRGAVAPGHRAR